MRVPDPLKVGDLVGDGTVVQVALGVEHGAALCSNGRVACWGSNEEGQCGAPLGLGPVAAVAAGGWCTVALCRDGRVACWGSVSPEWGRAAAALGPAAEVAAGRWHLAVRFADGRTRLWGRECDGVPWALSPAEGLDMLVACGGAATCAWGDRIVAEAPPERVLQVARGGGHAAALLADGRVACWGDDEFGQCAVPDRAVPAIAVAAGGLHTVALRRDGRVTCWGSDFSGQCDPPVGLGRVVAVAAGDRHTAALLADGRVACWGDDADGQCSVPQGAAPAIEVAAALRSTAALLADGRTRVWGRGGAALPWAVPPEAAVDLLRACCGSLERTWANELARSALPQLVGQVEEGAGHTALLLRDGSVLCLGDSAHGQCRVPERLGPVKEVAVGERHTVALCRGGSVRCWGDDADGQCSVPAGLSGAAAVAAGPRHSAARLDDGGVVVWGSGCGGVPWAIPPARIVDTLRRSAGSLTLACIDGLLGQAPPGALRHCDGTRHYTVMVHGDGSVSCLGDAPARWKPELEYVGRWIPEPHHPDKLREIGSPIGPCDQPEGLAGVAAASAGHGHVAALLEDGGVVCWGHDERAQCEVPAGLGPAAAVAAGGAHTMALLRDGRIACWGSNMFGQCEVPAGLADAVAVAAGDGHSAALLRGGHVACWGRNRSRQCNVPDAVQGRAVAIHLSGSGSWALDAEGRLHMWGSGAPGRHLPFEVSDERWLEFATRMIGKVAESTFPERVRCLPKFRTIATLHRLAGG